MTTPSPLLATLDELAKKATKDRERIAERQYVGKDEWYGLVSEQEFARSLINAYRRLRAIIAAADVQRDALVTLFAGEYRLTAGMLNIMRNAVDAYDAARAGDGEKGT